MSDDYVIVLAEVIRISPDAVHLAQGRYQVWIPRSLIHGADEAQLAAWLAEGGERKLRVFRWKARAAGLSTTHEGQEELF